MINPISDLALVLASTLTYILTHCGKYLYYISSQKAIVQGRSVRYVCSADQSKSVINASPKLTWVELPLLDSPCVWSESDVGRSALLDSPCVWSESDVG